MALINKLVNYYSLPFSHLISEKIQTIKTRKILVFISSPMTVTTGTCLSEMRVWSLKILLNLPS